MNFFYCLSLFGCKFQTHLFSRIQNRINLQSYETISESSKVKKNSSNQLSYLLLEPKFKHKNKATSTSRWTNWLTAFIIQSRLTDLRKLKTIRNIFCNAQLNSAQQHKTTLNYTIHSLWYSFPTQLYIQNHQEETKLTK